MIYDEAVYHLRTCEQLCLHILELCYELNHSMLGTTLFALGWINKAFRHEWVGSANLFSFWQNTHSNGMVKSHRKSNENGSYHILYPWDCCSSRTKKHYPKALKGCTCIKHQSSADTVALVFKDDKQVKIRSTLTTHFFTPAHLNKCIFLSIIIRWMIKQLSTRATQLLRLSLLVDTG